MSDVPDGVAARVADLDSIDWDNPEAIAVDGYTVAEIYEFVHDSVVLARCTECEEEYELEPDARGRVCTSCGADGSVTSPLVKLGLI